jgi:hypothetical protein
MCFCFESQAAQKVRGKIVLKAGLLVPMLYGIVGLLSCALRLA